MTDVETTEAWLSRANSIRQEVVGGRVRPCQGARLARGTRAPGSATVRTPVPQPAAGGAVGGDVDGGVREGPTVKLVRSATADV